MGANAVEDGEAGKGGVFYIVSEYHALLILLFSSLYSSWQLTPNRLALREKSKLISPIFFDFPLSITTHRIKD